MQLVKRTGNLLRTLDLGTMSSRLASASGDARPPTAVLPQQGNLLEAQ